MAGVEGSEEGIEVRMGLVEEGVGLVFGWRVALESLEIWVVVVVLVVGGLGTSTLEDSLSDGVDLEEDDDEGVFAFVAVFVVGVGLGASSLESLSEDVLSEEDLDAAVATAVVAAAGLI